MLTLSIDLNLEIQCLPTSYRYTDADFAGTVVREDRCSTSDYVLMISDGQSLDCQDASILSLCSLLKLNILISSTQVKKLFEFTKN